ncbi:MAG: hypothetical protein JWO19_5233 [Bryobacterales bacterium]|jgi:hypothetical protein|nr:hypothetical protein [Bryobacterales bacterium]
MQRDIPLSLILVREFGGQAHPLARVNDPGLVRLVRDALVQEKREAAQQTPDLFLALRLQREATEIEQAY